MIQNLLNHLNKVKKTGDGYLACCPAHDDEKPSLSIREKGGKLLVKCHAGCSQDEVLEALKQLGAWPEANDRPSIIAEYEYQNADGSVAYHICRKTDKTFAVKRPNGEWGLAGGKKLLYHLPEVIKAEAIVITEGEKDADTVRRLGFTGTTNPFGAGGWRKEYADHLKGKRVVVLRDNDDEGLKHANAVCHSLRKIAEWVKLVELPGLPHKGDVSDWAATKKPETARDELLELIKSAPEWQDPGPEGLTRVADVEARNVDFLWFPYIPLAKVTLIDGDPGVGKSWLIQALATGISLGEGIPGRWDKPSTSLILSTEDAIDDTIRPRLDSMEADISRVFVVNDYFPLSGEGFDRLERLIQSTKAIVVFIDPLVAYFGARLDMNKANETRRVMAGLAAVAEKHKCAVIGIRHLRKESGTGGKLIYRGTGSIDIVGAARSVLGVYEDSEVNTLRIIRHIKCNVAEKGPPVHYEIRQGRFFWIQDGKMPRDASGGYIDEEIFID